MALSSLVGHIEISFVSKFIQTLLAEEVEARLITPEILKELKIRQIQYSMDSQLVVSNQQIADISFKCKMFMLKHILRRDTLGENRS